MKHLLRALPMIALLSMGPTCFAKTIDLSNGYQGQSKRHFIKTIKNGQSIRFEFSGGRKQYVESILIAAIGKQRAYSFGKVFADGVEVATLGVPGRDPLYPIVIRERVSTIEVFATEGSKFKVTDFQIFTAKKVYESYSKRRVYGYDHYSIEDWGSEVVEIFHQLDEIFALRSAPEVGTYLEMKKTAMKVSASERVRDSRSLKTYKKVMAMLDVLEAVEELLLGNENMVLDHNGSLLIRDLLTIKEDILERYDLDA